MQSKFTTFLFLSSLFLNHVLSQNLEFNHETNLIFDPILDQVENQKIVTIKNLENNPTSSVEMIPETKISSTSETDSTQNKTTLDKNQKSVRQELPISVHPKKIYLNKKIIQ